MSVVATTRPGLQAEFTSAMVATKQCVQQLMDICGFAVVAEHGVTGRAQGGIQTCMPPTVAGPRMILLCLRA